MQQERSPQNTEVKFNKGDFVVVIESMLTNSQDELRLTPGLEGKVVDVDELGDLLLDFTAFRSLQWIASSNSRKLGKVAQVEQEVHVWDGAEEESTAVVTKIESSKDSAVLAPSVTQELQRLLAENNVSLLRALQDLRGDLHRNAWLESVDLDGDASKADKAEFAKQNRELQVGQAKIINGMVRSVGECRSRVETNNSLIQEMMDTVRELRGSCAKILISMSERHQLSPRAPRRPPALSVGSDNSEQVSRGLDSIEEEDLQKVLCSSDVDLAPIIQAIEEHRPGPVNFQPLLDDMRQDFLATLQGIRESTVTVMASQDANSEKMLAYMDMTRRDNEGTCIALLQAIRESRQEVSVSNFDSLASLEEPKEDKRRVQSTEVLNGDILSTLLADKPQ